MPTRKDDQVQKIAKGQRLNGKALRAFDQEAKREYDSGKTVRAISAESGRSYGAVHRALQRAGVQFRARGGNLGHDAAGVAGAAR
jgi:hypothetical protein